MAVLTLAPMFDDKIRNVLRRLEERDTLERREGTERSVRLRQVTPDVGLFLHTLVLAAQPQSIVEVGTSGGYSTIWLATAARAVGTTVTTLEIDPAKVRTATTCATRAWTAWLTCRRRTPFPTCGRA